MEDYNMKKAIAFLLALTMVFVFAACGSPAPAQTDAPKTEAPMTEAPMTDAPDDNAEIYIPVVSKGLQHAFWQAVKKGCEDAAAEMGVTIEFNGPASESDIDDQVDMLKGYMEKNPSAVCLAALSTDAVMEQLQVCLDKKIPVVGFDSGVPNAPEGSIYATAATNNETAAAVAADEIYKHEGVKDALAKGTADKPVIIGVLSQDATSDSIVSRTKGFVDKMKALCEEVAPGKVAVQGHEKFNAPVDGATIIIQVQIAATTDVTDVSNAATALLNTENLVAVFNSNEGAVTGFLAATADSSDLADGAKYGDLVVAGFDAGATQKAAVRNGWFIGSVTQDPYNIGYKAVELAAKAAKGEAIEDVDTGAKWYNAENIDDEDIALLVYD